MVFTSLVMIMLALLGFSNPLPFGDTLQHFLCFMLATGIFYFIFDVEEYVFFISSLTLVQVLHCLDHGDSVSHVQIRDARRVWFWRYSGLIATCVVCLFLGGVVSEFVQSMLPAAFSSILDICTPAADIASQYKKFRFNEVLVGLADVLEIGSVSSSFGC